MEAARERQSRRFAGSKHTCNADMGPTQLKEHCRIHEAANTEMDRALEAYRKG